MINQELISYIEQQLQKGLSQEVIFSNLISAGWHQEDIKEGFQYIDKINKNQIIPLVSSIKQKFIENKPSKKHIFLIIIIIMAVFIGGIFYFSYKKHSNRLLAEKESSSKIEVIDTIQPYGQSKSINEPIVDEKNMKETTNNTDDTVKKTN